MKQDKPKKAVTPPPADDRRITFEVDTPETKRQLFRLATAKGHTLSSLIRVMLYEMLAEEKRAQA